MTCFIEAVSDLDTVKVSYSLDCFKVIEGLSTLNVHPDIIFLDCARSLMNEKHLLDEFRKNERLKDIPVVMYSAFLPVDDETYYARVGVLVLPTRQNYEILKASIINTLSKIFPSSIPPSPPV